MSDQPASGDAGTNPFFAMPAQEPVAPPQTYETSDHTDINPDDFYQDEPSELAGAPEAEAFEEGQPAPDNAEAEAAGEGAEEAEGDTPDGEEENTETEGWRTVEIDGKTYTVPEDFPVDGAMMEADYRRKTQGLADERRTFEAERTAFQQQAQSLNDRANQVQQLEAQDLQIQTELFSLNAQIAQMDQNADKINELRLTDEIQYGARLAEYNALKTRRAELQGAWSNRLNQATANRQRELNERQTQTWGWAEKNIPGFNGDKWGEMKNFAQSRYGINEQSLLAEMRPALLQMLDDAKLGYEAAQAQITPPKPSKPTLPTDFKPARGVRGRGNPRPQPRLDTTNMSEFLAARTKR